LVVFVLLKINDEADDLTHKIDRPEACQKIEQLYGLAEC